MYRAFGKRLCDIVGASLALVMLSPVMLIVALAIVVGDGGPPLFVQKRVGRDLRTFRLYKFRSMTVGTQEVPSTEVSRLRVTAVGRLIRRLNLDELPQLWNVILGDMSLIGPRPALQTQSELLEQRIAAGSARLRPGLTGLAQVSSFDGMTASQKAAFDATYSRDVTLMKDLVIIARTFGYLFRRPPVY